MEKTAKQGGHCDFSPSSASRWLVCSGSVRLSLYLHEQGLIDLSKKGEAAQEGTDVHRAAEQYLKGEGLPGELSAEVAHHVRSYAAYIQDHVPDMQALQIERRVSAPHYFGTCDALAYVGGHLQLFDLKYGRLSVTAYENPQLMLYAAAFLDEIGAEGCERITLHIYQPRGFPDVSSYETTAEEVQTLAAKAADKIREGEESRVFSPSPAACRYCPARFHCRARVEALRPFFSFSSEIITEAERLELFRKKESLEALLSDIESHYRERLDNGETVPFLTYTEGRTLSKWADDAEPILRELLGEEAYRTTKSLITIGEARKKLSKDVIGKITVKSTAKKITYTGTEQDETSQPAPPLTQSVNDWPF